MTDPRDGVTLHDGRVRDIVFDVSARRLTICLEQVDFGADIVLPCRLQIEDVWQWTAFELGRARSVAEDALFHDGVAAQLGDVGCTATTIDHGLITLTPPGWITFHCGSRGSASLARDDENVTSDSVRRSTEILDPGSEWALSRLRISLVERCCDVELVSRTVHRGARPEAQLSFNKLEDVTVFQMEADDRVVGNVRTRVIGETRIVHEIALRRGLVRLTETRAHSSSSK